MTHKAASATCTTRTALAAAPTVLLDAREPCSRGVEAEAEDLFGVDQAAAQARHPSASPAVGEVAPPPFDIEDIEPPFDPPDPDDEVFQARRQTLDLDAGDAIEAALATAPTSAPATEPLRAPAISIHVSWERADASALLAACASDLRLARTEITEARGGIEGAIARFGKMASPDLLVLDTALAPRALLGEIDRLLVRLEARTRLMVIGDANDVCLVRDLARRGIAYFLAPTPDEVIARICDAYAGQETARVIAVVGARGGVGASAMAYNIAWSIAERQQASTALVDLDLSFGVAGFDLDACGAQSMGVGFLAPDLVDDAFLDRACVKQSEKLSVYAAPPSVAQPFDLEAEAVKRVIARVRRTAEFVVLDVPHQWAAWVKQALISADEVVIVATPDLASLRNAKSIMEALREGRKHSTEPLYVLSMTGAAKGPEISVRDYTEAMGAKPVEQLEFDPALFGMSAIKGKSIVAMAPRSKAAVAIDGLAWVLTGRTPAAPAKNNDLLVRTPPPGVAPAEAPTAQAVKEIEQSAAVDAPCALPSPLPSPRPSFAPATGPTTGLPTGLAITGLAIAAKAKRRRRARGRPLSYASARRQPTQPLRARGAIRACLTVAVLMFACMLSVQNRDLVQALGQASGVLH